MEHPLDTLNQVIAKVTFVHNAVTVEENHRTLTDDMWAGLSYLLGDIRDDLSTACEPLGSQKGGAA